MVSATAAVVLMLNGVQLFLPAPALMIDGRAWAPLRSVAERLGFTLAVPSADHIFAVRHGKRVPVTESKRIKGLTYVPVRFFRKLGAEIRFDPVTHAVTMTAVFPAEASPPKTSPPPARSGPVLSLIVADPALWANRQVVLPGEFLGWRANKLWPALRFGPPVSRSDWVFRTDGGAIYCTGQGPSQPFRQVGLRLEITATVRLALEGWPYLDVASFSRRHGQAALCCYVTTDRNSYARTQTARAHLLVRNDSSEPLDFTQPTSQTHDFSLRDAEGKTLWRWSQGRAFAQTVHHLHLAPGQALEYAEDIPLPAIKGLAAGIYYVSAELSGVAHSFQEPIEVQHAR